MTLYTGGGRHEDAILAAIDRNDVDFLATTPARWYDNRRGQWSADWRAFMTAKHVRKITASEQKALDRKHATSKLRADATAARPYPNKAIAKEVKKAAESRKETAATPPATSGRPTRATVKESQPEPVASAQKPAKEPKAPPQPPVSPEAVPDIIEPLEEAAREYLTILRIEAETKQRKTELAENIAALLEAVEQRSVLAAEWQVSRAKGVNVQIKKELLLAAGVTIDQVEAATVRKPTAYVVVTDPREARKPGSYRGEGGGE